MSALAIVQYRQLNTESVLGWTVLLGVQGPGDREVHMMDVSIGTTPTSEEASAARGGRRDRATGASG